MKVLEGRPNHNHAPAYGAYYMDLTAEWTNLGTALFSDMNYAIDFFKLIPAEKEDFRYLPEKWSVKEVILHIIETERIFQYRAFRFSRKDATTLSGFDEDWYAKNNNCSERSMDSLIEEFIFVRNSTIQLFNGMNLEMIDFLGGANGAQVTPRSLGWMTIGHTLHHCNIIKERYLADK